jgi:hypothetical protein
MATPYITGMTALCLFHPGRDHKPFWHSAGSPDRWLMLRLAHRAPIWHPAKRRCLKTVMQELMYMACRMVHNGRQCFLRFGRHCPGFAVYRDLYRGLASSG